MPVFAHPGLEPQNWHLTETDILNQLQQQRETQSALRDKMTESLPGNMKVTVKPTDPGSPPVLISRNTVEMTNEMSSR